MTDEIIKYANITKRSTLDIPGCLVGLETTYIYSALTTLNDLFKEVYGSIPIAFYSTQMLRGAKRKP